MYNQVGLVQVEVYSAHWHMDQNPCCLKCCSAVGLHFSLSVTIDGKSEGKFLTSRGVTFWNSFPMELMHVLATYLALNSISFKKCYYEDSTS